MLLQRQLRRLGVVEDGKRRHDALRNCAPQTRARARLFGQATPAAGGSDSECGAGSKGAGDVQLVLGSDSSWAGGFRVVGKMRAAAQRSAAQRCGVSILSGE
jgi:hypothetical protein